ncbi:MAG: hypothetical protein RMY29_014500 [Nostoc sp. CreGUA01]
MTYKQQLFDWIVVKEVSLCKWIIISEFRRRSDAESYCQVVKRSSTNQIIVVSRDRLTEFGL